MNSALTTIGSVAGRFDVLVHNAGILGNEALYDKLAVRHLATIRVAAPAEWLR